MHVAGMGMRQGEYRVLPEKPEAKTPLGNPRHRWGGSIEIDLKKLTRRWAGLLCRRIWTSGELL